MQVPPGYALWIASALRKAVSLPVIGVGRFKDPLQADRALCEGHADLIGVVRGQIADPDFAAKARAGAAVVDPHLPLVQPGVRRPDGPQPLARLHREPRRRARGRARRPDRRTGAGASSWSAPARAGCRPPSPRPAAATRSTSMRPATSRGGQIRAAASVPSRAELGDLVRNQLAEASRLGVRFHFGAAGRRRPRGRGGRGRRRRGHRGRPRAAVVGGRLVPGARRDRRAGGAGVPGRAGPRRRRARVPPGDQRGRAAGGPGMRAGDRHACHGRRPGPRGHARPGDVVDEGGGQGHHRDDRHAS